MQCGIVVKNTLLDWLILLFSTAMGVVSQLALKQWINDVDLQRFMREPLLGIYTILSSGYFWAYGLAAVSGVASWFWVLRRFDLGVAYPVAESLAFVLIILASSWLFSEPVPPLRWVGIALISAGLVFCR
jgi:multidrug transporter EmrE-like cation transporter